MLRYRLTRRTTGSRNIESLTEKTQRFLRISGFKSKDSVNHVSDTSKTTPLLAASARGNVEVMRELLNAGAEVDKSVAGKTPLMRATWFGKKDAVLLLLEFSSNVDCKTPTGETASDLARIKGRDEIATILSEHRARVHHHGGGEAGGGSGGDISASDSETDDAGSSVVIEEELGGSILASAGSDKIKVVVASALPVAAASKSPPRKLSATKVEVKLIRSLTKSTQGFLCKWGFSRENAINHRGINGTPLVCAVKANNSSAISELFRAGVDVNQQDAETEHTPIFYIRLISPQGARVAELLMSLGADVDAADSNGWTPLVHKAAMGELATVKFLLAAGANVKVKTNKGESVVEIALFHGKIEVAEFLSTYMQASEMERKSSLTTEDVKAAVAAESRGEPSATSVASTTTTPSTSRETARTSRAVRSRFEEELAQALKRRFSPKSRTRVATSTLEAKATTAGIRGIAAELKLHQGHIVTIKDLSKKSQDFLISVGFSPDADINAKFRNQTPIIVAVKSRKVAVLAELLEQGADVNALGESKRVALYHAAAAGRDDIVTLLLEAEARVNTADELGWTPLMKASYHGHISVVRLLLSHDANSEAVNLAGNTVYDIARASKKIKILSLLLRHRDVSNYSEYASTAGKKVGQLSKGSQEFLSQYGFVLTDDIDFLKDDWSPLMRASFDGNIAVIKDLIRNGATLDIQDGSGFTALMLACQEGKLEVVQLLVAAEAGLNIASESKITALFKAVYEGHVKVAELLIESGADVNQAVTGGWTALMVAASRGNLDMVKMLLRKKADAKLINDDGYTAQQIAQNKEKAAIVKILEQHLLNADERLIILPTQHQFFLFQLGFKALDEFNTVRNGLTPLLAAIKGNNQELVALLISLGADVNEPGADGLTPLAAANLAKFDEITAILLGAGAEEITTSKRGHDALELLEFSASYATGLHRRMASFASITKPNSSRVVVSRASVFTREVKIGELPVRIRNFLKKYGFDSHQSVNTLDQEFTPLMIAASEGEQHVVASLLENGVEVDKKREKTEATALYVASQCGRTAEVGLLLKYKADPNLIRLGGWTALMVATLKQHLDVVETLLLFGAKVSVVSVNKVTALYLAVQNNNQAIFNLIVKYGATFEPDAYLDLNAFLLAVETNNIEMTSTLLKLGIDVNASDESTGKSALAFAVENGYPNLVSLLLYYGANPNQTTTAGVHPLELAIKGGYFEIVRILLANGANPEQKNSSGVNALELAKAQGSKELVEYISKYTLDRKYRIIALTNRDRILAKSQALHNYAQELQDNLRASIITACRVGDEYSVLKLSERFGLEITDTDGNTLAMIALNYGHYSLMLTLLERTNSILENNSSGFSLIHLLIAKKRVAELETVLSRYPDALYSRASAIVSGAGELVALDTALMFAIRTGQDDMVGVILAHLKNMTKEEVRKYLKLKNSNKENAKKIASLCGNNNVLDKLEELKNSKIFDSWLAVNGINLDDLSVETSSGLLPLELAVTTNKKMITNRLVTKYNAIKLFNSAGYNVLHKIVLAGKLEFLDKLQELGFDFYINTESGKTVLELGLIQGVAYFRELLAKLQSLSIEIKKLINASGENTLHSAVRANQTEIVEMLLVVGFGANEHTPDGKSPLELAFECDNFTMIEKLLLAGADINEKNSAGYTLLHRAVLSGNVELVEILLALGADLTIVDAKGNTALHLAISVVAEDTTMVNLLLDNNASKLVRNDAGLTPYQLAASSRKAELSRLILEHKFSVAKKVRPKSIHDLTKGIKSDSMSSSTPSVIATSSYPEQRPSPGESKTFEGTSLEIDIGDVEIEGRVGGGGFGDVYKATWQDKEVAIKYIKGRLLDEDLKKEVALMAGFRHPNIVTFYGVVRDRLSSGIMMEFMPNGSFYQFMLGKEELSLRLQVSIIMDVTRALAHMHAHQVVHRDVKSLNLLLGDKCVRTDSNGEIYYHIPAKLGDFGLSRVVVDGKLSTGGKKGGSVYWSPPEIVRGERFEAHGDIFSFAVLMWEIMHRLSPDRCKEFSELPTRESIALAIAERRLRPAIAPGCPEPLQTIIRQCWSDDPQKRPSAAEAYKLLRSFESHIDEYTTTATSPLGGGGSGGGDCSSLVNSDIADNLSSVKFGSP